MKVSMPSSNSIVSPDLCSAHLNVPNSQPGQLEFPTADVYDVYCLSKTYVRWQRPQYCLSCIAAMKIPAPHYWFILAS